MIRPALGIVELALAFLVRTTMWWTRIQLEAAASKTLQRSNSARPRPSLGRQLRLRFPTVFSQFPPTSILMNRVR